ncbi:PTS sugar transporter subunit IIA [Thermohalobacter berrensis]|uniref:PTS fructose transporter subunit IIA n=1 Tax=Thermohalobacter berrensis TaxID=99594 RepID=A0A419T3G0_9FIRM|nr:PTS sugar transporter subunit IIA [Thermohalobacter berrensis]RKD32080.1 PTS fructose transporter subunit IIA [Thermohalobacter berrensis]
MKIIDLLTEDQICLDIKANDKEEVIKKMVDILDKNDRLHDKEKVLEAVFEREKTFSTGIGNGIAIPHGKSSGVKKASIVFARSKKGIDFSSLDGEPAFMFFLIVVPDKANDTHLKVLSQLSRKLMHKELRESLMKAETPHEIIEILDF